ncbi:MAG: hypothetical protein IPL79_15680 [Myxococcales bacterium]|nr:hypothetical protein [Myxococcales bacterium]
MRKLSHGVFTLTSSVALAASILVSQSGCIGEPSDDEWDDGDPFDLKSGRPDQLVKMPFYFSVPKGAVDTELARQKYSYPTVWQASDEVADAGLRIIAIKQSGTTPAAKRLAREDMSRQLAKAGVLQDGDIALTFRPEFAGSMAYPHIQMGVTHASLVYTKNGAAFNVDSPLDSEYSGQFNALHFAGGVSASGAVDAGVDAIQIVRPAGFDDARRAQLRAWAKLVAGNRAYGKVKFQSDYLMPIFVAKQMTTQQTVTELGKIILNKSSAELPMYCSEFVWHMLALSGCTAAEIEAAGSEGASCVDPVFAPMPLVSASDDGVGLAEGPLLALAGAALELRDGLVDAIFATGDNAARLSSGHRAVAEQVAPLMAGLSQFYKARAVGATASEMSDAAAGLNAGVGDVPNYSPTSFLVGAMQADGVRPLEYIATVLFVDGATYTKAKGIKMPAGESIPR